MKSLCLITLLFLLPLHFAFLEPTHSKLQITSVYGSDNTVSFTFKVVPEPGMKVTKDAPWKLSITNYGGLNLAKGNEPFETKDFDSSLAGFTFKSGPVSAGEKSGKISYQLRSFICTSDKSTCYPELHKGDYVWSVAK